MLKFNEFALGARLPSNETFIDSPPRKDQKVWSLYTVEAGPRVLLVILFLEGELSGGISIELYSECVSRHSFYFILFFSHERVRHFL